MRFHTAVTTLMAAGALAAIPQLAAAAGCFTATDVKIAHAEVVGTGGPPPTATQITLDGACYNLAAKVYLGQANGSLPLVPAGQITNNGSNQIILAIPEVLAPGDYLIELRTAANALGSSVLVTVAAPVAEGGGPLVFMARSLNRVNDGQTRYFVPSGASDMRSDEREAEMRIPVACTATDFSAWAEDTDHFPLDSGESITVTLRVNGADTALSCVIGQDQTSCGPSLATVNLSATDRVVIKAQNVSSSEEAEIVASWTCSANPPI